MPGDVEEIKRRLDLAEVIGEYVQLKRAGGANMKGRCPFHDEKTPSFNVSKERQLWHCFGCGEGGDLLSFVMKHEGLEFQEALKLLADRAGVELTQRRPQDRTERMRLQDVVEFATKLYEKFFVESKRAEFAREYLKNRGVSSQARSAFRLGYAPEGWDTLIKFAAQKGIRERELIKAGLALGRDSGGAYDRFRNRLLFPIADVHGNVVGFTARKLTKDPNEPKYINTPQTILYNKSAVLYGLHRAKRAIKKKDVVVVVEGNMDVVACHQAGFENTIAVSGTAFTTEQLSLIKRFTNNITMAFDADTAGYQAAERGIDIALSQGMNVRVIQLPPGAGGDPDEVIKKDPELWKKAITDAVPVMDWFFDRAFTDVDTKDPDTKSKVGKMLLPRIAQMSDLIAQSHWLQLLSQRLRTPEGVLRETMKRMLTPLALHKKSVQPVSKVSQSRDEKVAETFLGIVVTNQEIIKEAISLVSPEMLVNPDLRELYKIFILRYTSRENSVQGPDSSAVPDHLANILARVTLIRESAQIHAQTPPDKELRKIASDIRQSHIRSERERLAHEIASAEARGDNTAVRELTKAFQALINES